MIQRIGMQKEAGFMKQITESESTEDVTKVLSNGYDVVLNMLSCPLTT